MQKSSAPGPLKPAINRAFRGAPDDDVGELIRKVNAWALTNNVDDDRKKALYAASLISGDAQVWYDHLPPATRNSWSALRGKLGDKFKYSTDPNPQTSDNDNEGGNGESKPKIKPKSKLRGTIAIHAAGVNGNLWVHKELISGQLLYFGTYSKASAMRVTIAGDARDGHARLQMDDGHYLGVQMMHPIGHNFGKSNDSQSAARLVKTDVQDNYVPAVRDAGPGRSANWEIDIDGDKAMTFHWPTSTGSAKLGAAVCLYETAQWERNPAIYLCGNRSSYLKEVTSPSQWHTAWLQFEPDS